MNRGVSKIEVTHLDIDNIVDRIFAELTMRMLSIRMDKQEDFVALPSEGFCFEIRTEGSFVSQILFEMEEEVYQRIATILYKSFRISPQDTKIYVTEYLNIICGRILSEVNNILGKRSRLSIPHRIEKEKIVLGLESQVCMSYSCLDGILNIIVSYEIRS